MADLDSGTLAFAFLDGRMLVREAVELEIPELARLGPDLRTTAGPIPLGVLGHRPCVAVALEAEPDPVGGLVPLGLRELFARLDEPTTAMVARASQTLEWWFAHATAVAAAPPRSSTGRKRRESAARAGPSTSRVSTQPSS